MKNNKDPSNLDELDVYLKNRRPSASGYHYDFVQSMNSDLSGNKEKKAGKLRINSS